MSENIQKISDEKRNQIKQKSTYSMPDRPYEFGYSKEQIKRSLYSYITDGSISNGEEVSLINEINRIIDDVNESFALKIEDSISELNNFYNKSNSYSKGQVDNEIDLHLIEAKNYADSKLAEVNQNDSDIINGFEEDLTQAQEDISQAQYDIDSLRNNSLASLSVSYNASNGVISIMPKNVNNEDLENEAYTINLPVEKILNNATYNQETHKLVLTFTNGGDVEDSIAPIEIDISELVDIYSADNTTLKLTSSNILSLSDSYKNKVDTCYENTHAHQNMPFLNNLTPDNTLETTEVETVETEEIEIDDIATNGSEHLIMSKAVYNGLLSKADKVHNHYIVGDIYMNASNSANPSERFGGTWAQIQGKFLLSAGDSYVAGATGGEATHTLTTEELPSHTHTIRAMQTNGDPVNPSQGWSYLKSGLNSTEGEANSNATGGGQPHNNMPPYLAVYMWIKIA